MSRWLLGISLFVAFSAHAGPDVPVLEANDDELRLSYLCQASLVGDVHTVGVLAIDAGTDLGGFCRCYAKQVMADTKKLEPYTNGLQAIIRLRHEHATHFFDMAAIHAAHAIEDGSIDTFTNDDLRNAQNDMSETYGVLYDNNGTCVG